jgi:Mce-associated membrane protein
VAANADTADGELKETADTTTSADKESGDTPPAHSESTTAANLDTAEDEDDDVVDYESEVGSADGESDDAAAEKHSTSHVRLAIMVGLVAVIALMSGAGWLGFRGYQAHQAAAQRQLYLQIGRQCALNLTTIDWQHAEADVQRLMDSATGKFYEQFSQREQPFIDVVKKAQSKSVGTITEAGVESDSSDKADVLVAVSIKTTDLRGDDQPPREWRMRISVEKSGSDAKVSNVAFVP